ncbi:LysE family transporter [Bacillus anthracis]
MLFNTLKWIGVAYLLYIGIKLLRSKKTKSSCYNQKQ